MKSAGCVLPTELKVGFKYQRNTISFSIQANIVVLQNHFIVSFLVLLPFASQCWTQNHYGVLKVFIKSFYMFKKLLSTVILAFDLKNSILEAKILKYLFETFHCKMLDDAYVFEDGKKWVKVLITSKDESLPLSGTYLLTKICFEGEATTTNNSLNFFIFFSINSKKNFKTNKL